MNYHKLLFFGLLVGSLATQSAFGMQKQDQVSDFKNQALNWMTKHKTGLFISAGALLASYGLYKYFTKPEALEKRVKKNKNDLESTLKQKFAAIKNDAKFMDFHAGLLALTLPNNNGYVAGYIMVKNPGNQEYKFLVIFQDKADKKNLLAYRYAGQKLEHASQNEINYLTTNGYLGTQGQLITS
jgi:hypothetical protein